jgi:hypothetical protein
MFITPPSGPFALFPIEAGMTRRWLASEAGIERVTEMEQMKGAFTNFMVCVLLNQQIICS